MREDVDRDEPADFDLVDVDPVDFGAAVLDRDAVVLGATDGVRADALGAAEEEREGAARPDEPDRVDVLRVGTLDRPAMGRGYP